MISTRQLRALALALILPFTVVVHLCPHHFAAPVPLEGYGNSVALAAVAPQAMAVHTPSCHGTAHKSPGSPAEDHKSEQPEDCSCDNHPADLASNFTKPVISLPLVRPEVRAESWVLALSSPAAHPAYWLPDHTAPPRA